VYDVCGKLSVNEEQWVLPTDVYSKCLLDERYSRLMMMMMVMMMIMIIIIILRFFC